MNNRKLYLEIKKEDDMKLLYVDLFCGAGGTSTGVESARLNGERCAKVIACVNHDKNAIASHAANHPEALHFTEDIRTLELSPLVEHVLKTRVLYPDAFVVLWASLECTNFSKAKGGQPDTGGTPFPVHRIDQSRLYPNRERGRVHVMGADERGG